MQLIQGDGVRQNRPSGLMTPTETSVGVFLFSGGIMDSVYSSTLIVLFIFLASLVSVELAVAAAIIEIAAGVLVGNVFHLQLAPWMDFIAMFGGVLLTFLAGAEVDPHLMRSKLKESLLIGGLSFLIPYLSTIAYCYWVAGWTWKASLIAGCALSTTSLAVVYAVLVETGLTDAVVGKVLMAATFVTDIGTALALSLTFAEWNWQTLFFLVISAIIIALAPWFIPKVFSRYGDRVIEPEIKLILLILFALMSLAKWGQSHAVLPVFVLGLALANVFRLHRGVQHKLRIVAFAMITPFFFIRGGMNVSIPDLVLNWKLLAALFAVKTVAKFIGVWPLAKRFTNGHAAYTTLLMSTGLTFGTISAMYGLQAGHITQTQFSILVAVVIATAIVPTFIAQRWFSPELSNADQEEIMAQEEESL